MPSFFQRLKGDAYLGYRAVIAHPIKRLFDFDPRTGKERFLGNFGTEGLLPTSAEDRAVLLSASRCIHCGLCDAHDANVSALPRMLYDGASLLPVALTRSTTELPQSRAAIERLSDDALSRAEAVCPTRVPLRSLAAYARRKLAELDRLVSSRPVK